MRSTDCFRRKPSVRQPLQYHQVLSCRLAVYDQKLHHRLLCLHQSSQRDHREDRAATTAFEILHHHHLHSACLPCRLTTGNRLRPLRERLHCRVLPLQTSPNNYALRPLAERLLGVLARQELHTLSRPPQGSRIAVHPSLYLAEKVAQRPGGLLFHPLLPRLMSVSTRQALSPILPTLILRPQIHA